MRFIFVVSLCLLSGAINAQSKEAAQSAIIGQLTELREVEMKLTTTDETGASVLYMKCNDYMDLCEQAIPAAKTFVVALPGDSLATLNITKYLDVKMMGLQDSIASCHFTLVGAGLPETNKSWNCSASLVLDKEKGWMITKHQCRK